MSLSQLLSESAGRLRDIFRFGQRPPEGPSILENQKLNNFRQYVSDQLNPAKLKSLLRAVDGGDLATTLSLFQEIEGKDLHLHGVANTRRMALTSLDWEVTSAAESMGDKGDKGFADAAAAFVRESLSELECFDGALEHLAGAIGPNVAVLELVWDRHGLIDLVPIPSYRLRTDPNDPALVRVATDDSLEGIPAVAPKFVVHIPKSKAGFPFSMTLCHAQAMVYLIKMLSIADWASYCETFGQPVRWAKYDSSVTSAEKRELIDMLKNMGSSAFAAFSSGVDLQIIESSQRGTSPFEAIVNWAERKQSIGWLGQNLTTDTTGGTGTFAAGKVHDEVRGDLLEDDVKKEALTVRSQIISPMVAFEFPQTRFLTVRTGMPQFGRRFREEVERKLEAEVIALAQQTGMRVPEDWAHKRLAIPKPEMGEKVLVPSLDAFGEGLTEDVGAVD